MTKHHRSNSVIRRIFSRAATSVAVYAIGVSSATLAQTVPAPAAQVGYTINSFHSNFTASTVDVLDTKNRGFNWYYWDLYGYRAHPAGVQLNSDGTITLNGDNSGSNGQIVSAVQYRDTNSYVGTSIGGGAYFEAELKFDPQAVNRAPNKHFWPAFWALPLEGNVIAGASQWKGQPTGYTHAVETDFMEFFPNESGTPNWYGGGMHDWFGIIGKACAEGGLCNVSLPYSKGKRQTPSGTDFTQFHRYGFLWVPATAQSRGYAKFYFDGEQVGEAQEWDMFQDQPPAPTDKPWAFGVLDRQHQFLILGTGSKQPMTIRFVDVWQAHTSENLVN